MFHDGSGSSSVSKSCDKNGFVMSSSRGTKGEVKWSGCSRSVIYSLDLPCLEESSEIPDAAWDHYIKFGEYPGQYWTPDEQCKVTQFAENEHKTQTP